MSPRKLLFGFLLAAFVMSAEGKNRVMPWMCLDRCHEDVAADLAQIDKISPLLSAVSFESHDLDFNGELKDNHFSKVFPRLSALGLEGHAMVTTAKIEKLRQLWIPENRAKFIGLVVKAAVNNSWDGVNIDFEPEGGDPPTASDAKEFASFLDALAVQLHGHKIHLSVDIASWSAFWDAGLLAATRLDAIITMDTYCGNFTLFEARVERSVKQFGVDRLGVGLMTINPTTRKPFSLEEMQARFRVIKKNGIKEIDIWDCPIPDLWLPLIEEWI